MKAFVEGLVLIGGFLAFAAVGGYAVSWLGDFLDESRGYLDAEYAQQEEQSCLNIAAASPWAVQMGSEALRDMKNQHPNLRCTLSAGEEPELLRALSAGRVDVVIIRAKAEGRKEVRQREVALRAQPFTNEDGVTVTPIGMAAQSQFVVWKKQDCRPFIMEFVRRLCGQEA